MAIYKNIHGTTKNEFGIGDVKPIAIRTNAGYAQFKHAEQIEEEVWKDMVHIQDMQFDPSTFTSASESVQRVQNEDKAMGTFSNEYIQNFFNVDEESNGFNNSDFADYHCIIRDTLNPKDAGDEKYLWSIAKIHDYLVNTIGRSATYANTLVKRNAAGSFAAHEIFLNEYNGSDKPALIIGAGPSEDEEQSQNPPSSFTGAVSFYREDGIDFGKYGSGDISLTFSASTNIGNDFSIIRKDTANGNAIINNDGTGSIIITKNNSLSPSNTSVIIGSNNDIALGRNLTLNSNLAMAGTILTLNSNATQFFRLTSLNDAILLTNTGGTPLLKIDDDNDIVSLAFETGNKTGNVNGSSEAGALVIEGGAYIKKHIYTADYSNAKVAASAQFQGTARFACYA